MGRAYDYLIVGSGLSGAVFAHEAVRRGKRCLVLEKRDHIGGNAYTEEIAGVTVHRYGAHIFHTDSERVWRYVNRLTACNRFVNRPLAYYRGKLYSLPFTMHTFYQLWGITRPQEARAKLAAETAPYRGREPANLEEQALRTVGPALYETLIKGYTEKQWGRPCRELPADIIKRLPVRFTFDSDYYTSRYQGIPEEGYTALAAKLLAGAEVRLGSDFLADPAGYRALAARTVYTGTIDSYFDYRYGPLVYRSLRFETEVLEAADYQGVAVMNYPERDVPYTRVIEHRHFAEGSPGKTVVTREYPRAWEAGLEPYYPVNDEENGARYRRYAAAADGVLFLGRLARYAYLDMDQAIGAALTAADREFGA